MINVYPRPRHTRKGDRNLNPHSTELDPLFRLKVRLALRIRATLALNRSSEDSLQLEV